MLQGSQEVRARLLVVEDDDDVREEIGHTMRSEGFDVELAWNGDEALSILRNHPSFDLILLDLMLPKTDGWQFRLTQRADPLLSAIPVIAMSASTSAQARAIDADAYVPKPFTSDALIGAVRQVLQQRRMLHLDRLASLGRVAAGIAHEVNNPLTYVYANLSMARNSLTASRVKPAAEPHLTATQMAGIEASIERALEGVDRVRVIMDGVRLFVRAPEERHTPVDVRVVIDSSLAVLNHELQQKATVQKQLDDVPLIYGNRSHLGQLMINLLTNALDSVPLGNPQVHSLTVRTSTSAAGEIVIEVEDTGSGMSEEVRSRIFEPFFTTKPPGVGTGLGLSICHGIARSHGATIQVESHPGKGSCFRVVFPKTSAITSSSLPAFEHRRRVLVIDDDPITAAAVQRILELDNEVRVVADGEAALKLIDQEDAKPDVILCDVHLGPVTSQQIYEKIHQSHPDLVERIVFMKTVGAAEGVPRFVEMLPNSCLDKPFTKADFKKAVDRLQSRGRTTSGMRMRAVTPDEAASFPPSSRLRGR